MRKNIDRRLRALEAIHPQQDAAKGMPQWLVEWGRDRSVYRLMDAVVTFDNREEYGDRCGEVPSSEQADKARAELRERFGDEAAQWIIQYGTIWREFQDEC